MFPVAIRYTLQINNPPESFRKESAQNIDIVTQFMCDQLTNACKANQAAKDVCQQARAAASAATKGSGAQADAFNSIFGIITVSLPDFTTG